MSTCAYLLTSARSRSSMNWSKPSTNSALITRCTSTNRSSVTREKMSSRWSSSAEEIYQYLFGEKIKPETPDRASIWTDTNVYNELGIPAIKIGPRGRRISARNEEIEIDVMVKAAHLYALMAVDICSRKRPRAG